VLSELRPGLWRWTARHPGWREDAEPESPADWPRDVGCVAYRASEAFVFIDPLLPAGAENRFWTQMDPLVGEHDWPVLVLTTIGWHRRSRDEFAERYGASTSRAKTALPQGVETIPLRGAGETMVWLPDHAALVPGDRLLADRTGGLRLCPESWLGYLPSGIGLAELRGLLRPLLDLPVELVLVSHGEPVLSEGRRAIARALEPNR